MVRGKNWDRVQCQTYSPEGGHADLFKRIREVGQGYTLIGTNYKYNERNQLIHRSNEVRYEAYDYKEYISGFV